MQARYTQDHQYIIVEDGVGTVGITNYAQEKLSDVTTVELPHVGTQVQKGGAVGVIESVKVASDLYSPVGRWHARARDRLRSNQQVRVCGKGHARCRRAAKDDHRRQRAARRHPHHLGCRRRDQSLLEGAGCRRTANHGHTGQGHPDLSNPRLIQT
jgi:Glycine cleavage H-protein